MVEHKLAPASQPSADKERRAGLVVLGLALAVGAALRLWLALTEVGIFHPDEIYQGLEPAHWLVFGYGLLPWEFIEGARNWTFPGFCAALLKLTELAGLAEPTFYLPFVRIVFALIGTATIWSSYHLARTRGAARLPAAVGAAMLALAAPVIFFAPRALSENLSVLLLMLGLSLMLRTNGSLKLSALGASLFGLAVMVRLQSGLFCVAILCMLTYARRWKATGCVALTFAVWALADGLMDRLTWGGWWQAAAEYIRFNIVDAGRGMWTVGQPPQYYVTALWASLPALAIVGGPLALAAAAREPGLLLLALAYLGAYSATPHKEFRYILPLLPLVAALVGIGLDVVGQRLPGLAAKLLLGLALASGAASAATLPGLTFQDLGEFSVSKDPASVFGRSEPTNQLLLAAHDLPDLCGLKLENKSRALSGGYSYLHRPVPFYGHEGPPRSSGYFNYIISDQLTGESGRVVARDGSEALRRVGPGGCQPDPDFVDRL